MLHSNTDLFYRFSISILVAKYGISKNEERKEIPEGVERLLRYRQGCSGRYGYRILESYRHGDSLKKKMTYFYVIYISRLLISLKSRNWVRVVFGILNINKMYTIRDVQCVNYLNKNS